MSLANSTCQGGNQTGLLIIERASTYFKTQNCDTKNLRCFKRFLAFLLLLISMTWLLNIAVINKRWNQLIVTVLYPLWMSFAFLISDGRGWGGVCWGMYLDSLCARHSSQDTVSLFNSLYSKIYIAVTILQMKRQRIICPKSMTSERENRGLNPGSLIPEFQVSRLHYVPGDWEKEAPPNLITIYYLFV